MIDTLLPLAVLVYLLAGMVKGTIGLGLPTTAVSLLAQFADTRMAIALVVIPMIVTNLWQIYRAGAFWTTLRRYWVLALSQMLLIGVVSQWSVHIPTATVTGVLGGVIVLFAIVNLWRRPPPLPARFDRPAQLLSGTTAGIMGGICGIWAPAIVVYLSACRLDNDAFVRAVGFLLFSGSVILALGYWRAGLLTGAIAQSGVLMLAPALIGFALGERLRRRLTGDRFRQVVLLFFLLMGVNLLRRAIFGG